MVDRRVLSIIAKYLQCRSEVHTDDWCAYRWLKHHLPNHVARHMVVVHANNFVNPLTGVHTQKVELSCANLKQGVKRRKGVSKDDLQAYLDDRMWRPWRGLDNIIVNILTVLAVQFSNYVVLKLK